ncbi:hypothetical protein [Paratractidigestivibacter sp.]|uniref:hypothetical protein n=1 Tax=Paratractidigestivibacter sp. TaxID=2847316 RepID=UPI002ABDC566|nr:hypothetical protein [Paratractidigestivibacter sp.]
MDANEPQVREVKSSKDYVDAINRAIDLAQMGPVRAWREGQGVRHRGEQGRAVCPPGSTGRAPPYL